MSAATCSTASRVRPERKTVAPCAANSLATILPTEPPAPKMTACLFCNNVVDGDAVVICSFSFPCLFPVHRARYPSVLGFIGEFYDAFREVLCHHKPQS